jgi:hypothetical protein
MEKEVNQAFQYMIQIGYRMVDVPTDDLQGVYMLHSPPGKIRALILGHELNGYPVPDTNNQRWTIPRNPVKPTGTP